MNPIFAPHSFSGPAKSSPCRNHFSRPANPIATPQSFHRAGESHRQAAIFSVGRRIPSSRRNLFSGPANPITVPQSFQRANKPNRFSEPAHPIAKPPNLICRHFILAGASSSCRHIKFSHIISKFILKSRIIIYLRQHSFAASKFISSVLSIVCKIGIRTRPCCKPSDQPRDAARREECSNWMKRV